MSFVAKLPLTLMHISLFASQWLVLEQRVPDGLEARVQELQNEFEFEHGSPLFIYRFTDWEFIDLPIYRLIDWIVGFTDWGFRDLPVGNLPIYRFID